MKTLKPLFYSFMVALAACGGNQTTDEQSTDTTMAAEREPVAEIAIEEVWASDTLLRTPESVLYDSERKVLYVSNINAFNKESKDQDGFLSKLSTSGEILELKWVTGLNDPKGMGLAGNTLYVSDLDEIVSIDVQTGEIIEKLAVDEAKFLNDITIMANGDVIVTDSDNSVVYRLKDGKPEQWIVDKDLDKPNGLLWEGEKLLMVSMNKGKLRIINPADGTYEDWVDGLPGADGIAKTETGDYFVSNWNGEVYYVGQDGDRVKVLDTKEQKINAADIDYSKPDRLLFVPTFFDNRVVAYRLKG